VNIGIVLVFAAFYLRFRRRPGTRGDGALSLRLCRRTSVPALGQDAGAAQVEAGMEAAIRTALQIAVKLGVATGTVQRVRAEIAVGR
jgi:hypothetical protein